MSTALALSVLLISAISLACLLALLLRKSKHVDLVPLEGRLTAIAGGQERTDRLVRDELAKGREEGSNAARAGREELAGAVKDLGDSLVKNVGEIGTSQKNQLNVFSGLLHTLTDTNEARLEALRLTVETQLKAVETSMTERHKEMREEANANRTSHREEIANSLKHLGERVQESVTGMTAAQKAEFASLLDELRKLTTSNEAKLESLRGVVDGRLKEIQEANDKKLEQMRATGDEKLQDTLEKRFSEKFSQVADRLEKVHLGLGEMQALAAGVGDLKRLFANGRARGTWGEVQLGALLSDILTPDQFAENVALKEFSSERVEYAVKLPGDEDAIYLPVDSKFPMEDYERLVDAFEAADADSLEDAGRKLEARVKACAKEIHDKYVNPPKTTGFGIMFLPSEALYAEVARRADLLGVVRRDYRVIICGPSTLAATLLSFRMGFKTLAIQKRTSEVWTLLGAVKSEFGKFGGLLEQVRKKLDRVSSSIDDAAKKSRTIERRLRDVEVVPDSELPALLESAEPDEIETPLAPVGASSEDDDVPF